MGYASYAVENFSVCVLLSPFLNFFEYTNENIP